jgi:mRNA interferase MazF
LDEQETTGMRESSRLMVDKVTTIPRSKLGERVGQSSDENMIRVSRALVVFLGLAGSDEPAHFTRPESLTRRSRQCSSAAQA